MSSSILLVYIVDDAGILELKLKALILDIIHNIDVVKQLIQAQVYSPEDWAWKKQLRFYMSPAKKCYVQMVDAEIEYTYEYQVLYSSLFFLLFFLLRGLQQRLSRKILTPFMFLTYVPSHCKVHFQKNAQRDEALHTTKHGERIWLKLYSKAIVILILATG